ncbi:helix-turn-helix domain-containing protein [Nonomuraea sp. NPDC005650]|uniref:helix-turn-helix domain-containing protein n=1 Tax=Nonomuraea sp. NPDC005650 TaxID=3157045 RepID=UPI0033B7F84E
MALRARLILACDAIGGDGLPVSTKVVAEEIGVSRETVSKWRRRFLADRLMGLADEPRPGRPRTVSDEQVAELVARTLETKPANATHWSTRSMRRADDQAVTTRRPQDSAGARGGDASRVRHGYPCPHSGWAVSRHTSQARLICERIELVAAIPSCTVR